MEQRLSTSGHVFECIDHFVVVRAGRPQVQAHPSESAESGREIGLPADRLWLGRYGHTGTCKVSIASLSADSIKQWREGISLVSSMLRTKVPSGDLNGLCL